MTNKLSNSKTPQERIQAQKAFDSLMESWESNPSNETISLNGTKEYAEYLKNKYFESLMIGWNEAVAIEKGELIGKETALEIQS